MIDQMISINNIAERIYAIRGVKVMLDRDLAALYEVETRTLKQSVRRNGKRFPDDFMFELTKEEQASLRSQNVILKRGQHTKFPSFAFTEQGVAMLSGLLNSDRAIEVNIQIMRAFVQLRHLVIDHAELKRELDELRGRTEERFQIVFSVLDQLVSRSDEPARKIGFVDRAE